MSGGLYFALFLASWFGFALWANSKRMSGTVSIGGGLVFACVALVVAGSALKGIGQGKSEPSNAFAQGNSGGLPSIEYSDDTSSYVEISNCVVQTDYLVDCHFKNKTPNFQIRPSGILVVYYDAQGVKLGDRMAPDVSIAPGETAKSRLLAYDKVSEISRIKVSSR